jgi:hypothetical protein
MPPWNRFRAAEAYDAAATLFFTLFDDTWDFKALNQLLF